MRIILAQYGFKHFLALRLTVIQVSSHIGHLTHLTNLAFLTGLFSFINHARCGSFMQFYAVHGWQGRL